MNRYFNYPNLHYWDTPTSDTNDFKSGVIALAKEPKWVGPNYDFERMKHTQIGRHMMDAAHLELTYEDINDPGLKAFWAEMGLSYTVHEKEGEAWLSFVPASALEDPTALPVMLAFRPSSGKWGVFSQSFYYHMNMIAAQGDLIVLIFSTEDNDSNELWVDILEEAKTLYPIDPTRVYLTGHSHYGEFALEFMRRHHDIVAGVAQQGDCPGIHCNTTDTQLEQMHSIDMPIIDVAGYAEMNSIFPVNVDITDNEKLFSGKYAGRFPADAHSRIVTWQKRLYASRCEVLSEEAILAARNGTRAEQMLGFPTDHSETMFVDGVEVYIGDIQNVDGKKHLRIVAVENLTHTTCAFMHTLSWSFLRRFARDLEKDAVIELFD